MDYQDSNPENRSIVEEIRKLPHFNNLHGHLPDGFYRKLYLEIRENGLVELAEKYKIRRISLWDSIDKFISDNNFRVDDYWINFNQESNGGRERSQISLCPLYLFLRKKGFSFDELCR